MDRGAKTTLHYIIIADAMNFTSHNHFCNQKLVIFTALFTRLGTLMMTANRLNVGSTTNEQVD